MSFQSNCGYFLITPDYIQGSSSDISIRMDLAKMTTEAAMLSIAKFLRNRLASNGVYIVTDVTDISFLNKVGGKILKGSCQIRQSFFGQNLA